MKAILTSIITTIFFAVAANPVLAQSIEVSPDPSVINLRPINFPLFISLEQARSFSVYSYIAFGLSLVFVLLVTYWIFRIIANAVAIMQSQGDSNKVAEATKKIQAIFIGIATMFLFVAIFSVIGLFFNLGTIFEWPKKLSLCDSGEFYVTKALEMNTATEAEIDLACFGNPNNASNGRN